ncbi:M36 family metallopeptidase [Pendulispora albinea]|uniref:M36 family metallopeptidase n=1 Tax=Pendulispora albinea TaxID=2741071 RepID=A0ABZ2MC86_9BACT
MGALAAASAMLVAFPMCAGDGSPTASIPENEITPEEAEARAALAHTPLGHVVSTNAVGKARFVIGSAEMGPASAQGIGGGARLTSGSGTARAPAWKVGSELASRIHLSRHAEMLGLNEPAVRAAVVTSTHALQGGGRIVQFEQRVDGVPVFHTRASVLLDANQNLVSLTSNLHPAAVGTKAVAFPTTAESALAHVYAAHFGVALPPSAIRDRGIEGGGDARDYAVSTPADAPRLLDATAQRVLFPRGDELVPAYHIEFIGRAPGSVEDDGYAYVLDAVSGALLYKASITASEAFKYRVWADRDGIHTPADGPYKRAVPYRDPPVPSNPEPAYADMELVTMEGFNTNRDGRADPWLPAGATVTSGNNVHAYSDRNDTHESDAGVAVGDGFEPGVDIEADLTDVAQRAFDRTYDPAAEPESSANQIKAAVTQLFYVTNWLHDYWYDSGFDEAAGVAQMDNFGRGGVAGDPMLAEAQDGAQFGLANNANMSTRTDGKSPRMQMYVWNPAIKRNLTTNPPIAFDEGWGAARSFGAQSFDVQPAGREIVLANDGSANPTWACGRPTNVAGKIAVIDRGGAEATCSIPKKLQNAKLGGALGALFVNDTLTGAQVLSSMPTDAEKADLAGFPILTLSQKNGAELKAKLAQGTVTAARMFRDVESPKHDGTIDNSIVAHEWGHYFHHRLVVCGSPSCGGMSEGWGDFNALFMSVRANDALEEAAFPAAQYATAGSAPEGSNYYGIRRAPYSTSFAKNPFTFKHVSKKAALPATAPLAITSVDMSELHNVGEVWAETLFEAYAGFLQAATGTFEEKKRRFSKYIVAGMKLTPVEPTFTEQRDAILTAVLAGGSPSEFEAVAGGFRKRGLGTGAIAPPTGSETLEEVVEDFTAKGNIAVQSTGLEATLGCDSDGHLDAGETGKFTVEVKNLGWTPLANTKVTVRSSDPNIVFDHTTESVPELSPLWQVAKLSFAVTVKESARPRTVLPITVKVENPDSAIPSREYKYETLANYDDALKVSATDDVESERVAWMFAGTGEKLFNVWGRAGAPDNHVWHAEDMGITTDERLVSPDLVVGSAGDFTIAFKHRYRFEFTAATSSKPAVYFDGGVLELSEDGGATWKDISTYNGVNPGYVGDLESDNPLPARRAWAASSENYPAFKGVSLNLGSSLAGKTVKVRFRVVTDGGVGAPGWDIDDIAFGGITNKPFAALVDDVTPCVQPIPDAGTGGDAGGGKGLGSTHDDSGCSVASSGARAEGTSRAAVRLGLALGLLAFVRRRRGDAVHR